jgi:hypothetical protein
MADNLYPTDDYNNSSWNPPSAWPHDAHHSSYATHRPDSQYNDAPPVPQPGRVIERREPEESTKFQVPSATSEYISAEDNLMKRRVST